VSKRPLAWHDLVGYSLLGGLLALLLSAAWTLAAEPAKPEQRLIHFAYYGLGKTLDGGIRVDVRREPGPDFWAAEFRERLLPVHDRGADRLLISNPFGTIKGEPMAFDQQLDAREAGLGWLADGYYPALDAALALHPDLHVVTYLGTPEDDADFDVHPAAAWERALEVVAPIEALAAKYPGRVGIGLDHVTHLPPDSMPRALADRLCRNGVRVFVEGWYKAGQEHWLDFDVIVMEFQYRKAAAGEKWAVPVADVPAEREVVRLITGRVPEAAELRERLDDPETTAAHLHRLSTGETRAIMPTGE